MLYGSGECLGYGIEQGEYKPRAGRDILGGRDVSISRGQENVTAYPLVRI